MTSTRKEHIEQLKQQGFTQKQIAEQLSLNPATVSRILSARDSPVDLSEYPGIHWDRYTRKYIVQVKGKIYGRYSDFSDAIYYRNKAAIQAWGFKEATRRGYILDPVTLMREEL